ncbi:MAG TPA: choice-of-anchor I family protein, partial [Bacteroidia bacterium]
MKPTYSFIKSLGLLLLAMFLYASLGAQTLLHYWNFNTTSSYSSHISPSTSVVTGAALDTLRFTGGTSLIDYANGTGQGFDVNNYNARNSDVSGNHLRFNNPIYGALIFSLPTTGYKDPIVKYASLRSGSGAYYQFIYYTTDGSNYTLFDTIQPTTTATLYTIDFSDISTADDNANFKVKILFGQGGGGTAGNNRLDNFTLEATSISGGDVTAPTVVFNPLNNNINELVNIKPAISFNEDIRLINNSAIGVADSLVIFKLNDSAGSDVAFTASYNNRIITITPNSNLLNNQTYYLALKSNRVEDQNNNAVVGSNSVKFKTIAVQTVFSKGDIVPIAYRMNATATDDEVSLLTLVNILPGTIINFTDAKYTDNTQAQCAGGLTWTAPSSGVAAGTVIAVKNDLPGVNIGTLSGSAFGLSSGGDQFIVYTGTPANASHITALSSNAWINSNTSCSGSASKLPAGLQDGVSSINLSSSVGNVSGNTANSYYKGPQKLPFAQLRDSILNPANWSGTASGTAPQTWPEWAFDGPPVVSFAKVLTSNSIQLVFNKDMDNSSVTDVNNYTGIAGLQNAVRTTNGSLKDTVVLTYSNNFTNNASYTLTVNSVKDNQMISMFTEFKFSFTYTTKIAFEKTFIVVNEQAGTLKVNLNVSNPSVSTVDLKFKSGKFSTASNNSDFTFTDQTINITGTTSVVAINLPITNDQDAEQDEYLTLELSNANGIAIEGKTLLTVYIKDNDKLAPSANKELELKHLGSYKPDSAGSTCEIVAYDSISKRIFMTSAIEKRLDIADFSNPAAIKKIKSIDMSVYGGITSVTIKNGIVAVASPNVNEQLNGKVIFFNTNGDYIKDVTVGALPDMITFTPDGKKVLTANEGQPSADYTVDPEGSVSVIDISGGVANLTQSNVNTAAFTAFNSQESSLINSGVRKLFSASTLAQDFEPEYIAVSSDSKKAYITLQENNAIAELDLQTNTITSVWALGTKDWSASGNGLDASDNNQNVLISSWPIKSFYIPDAVATFNKGGVNYIVTANEGDEKEYSALNERTTVGASTYKLDSASYPQAAMLKETYNLGRLRVTNLNGDTDKDGDFDQIYT